MDILKSISQTKIFGHFSAGEIRSLVNAGITRRYGDNEWIVCQGDVWPYLFIVLEGNLIAVKESLEGRSLILETFNAGEVFWGLAFFLDGAPMPAGLRASPKCELVLWSRQDLYPLLMRDGQLSWELARSAIQRALRASEIVDELAFQPVAGRLARFLIERFGESQPERVARSMTLDEIAAHIGTTREVVCRILQRFADQGLIRITRTEFTFTDRETLKGIAQITPE
jgi:CRP/FNR family transcriptional regulator